MLEHSNMIMDVHQDAIVLISSSRASNIGIMGMNWTIAGLSIQIKLEVGLIIINIWVQAAQIMKWWDSVCPGRSKKEKFLLTTAWRLNWRREWCQRLAQPQATSDEAFPYSHCLLKLNLSHITYGTVLLLLLLLLFLMACIVFSCNSVIFLSIY
jgi:hypothetical protein